MEGKETLKPRRGPGALIMDEAERVAPEGHPENMGSPGPSPVARQCWHQVVTRPVLGS